jgi:hypothetical protein
MIFGGLLAGFLAAIRSVDPGAAGFDAGLIGWVVGVFSTAIQNPTWVKSPAEAAPLLGISVVAGVSVCLMPLFGLVCGEIGGLVATTVLGQDINDRNAA